MPFDSNGNFSLVPSYKATSGDTIRTEQHNPVFEDVAAALSKVLLRSGVAPMMGPLNMNGYKFLNIPAASGPGDPVTLSQLQEMIADPWAFQPIGAFIPYDANEGLPPPPKNKAYRYVLLTAGQAGAGAYNEGVLTGETVTGTDPTITATAVVSLTGSPLNGKTIRLLNTERRFIRPGSAGTLEDSQNLLHGHGVNDPGHVHNWGNTARGFQLTPGNVGAFAQGGGNPGDLFTATNTTGITIQSSGGNEARPRSLGVTYYRRVL